MTGFTLPEGVITASLTPVHHDLSVNHLLLKEHCDWLVFNGSSAIVLLGTTGEANSFSVAERKEILERLVGDGFPASKILVGTGCCSLTDTVELSDHALNMGVPNVLVMPPFYYRDVTAQGLFAYFSEIIERIGSGNIRIYLYHFPRMSGIHMTTDLLAKLRHQFHELIAGMKDSGGDPEHMSEVLRTIPGFRLYAGNESHLLHVLDRGGPGCISATTNLTISVVSTVYESWRKGAIDQGVVGEMLRLRSILEGAPFVPTLKGILALAQDPAWSFMRPPNTELPHDRLQEVVKDFKETQTLLPVLNRNSNKADLQ